ncbi:hypothetical protein D4758_10175 [Enterocloster citroniae]|nr:hypothetical protein [Enterocloster citroniae]RGC10951.1 hypothetical protein DWZ14_12345 [Enterocloster citroniae]
MNHKKYTRLISHCKMTYVTFCIMFTYILRQFSKKPPPALAADRNLDYNGRGKAIRRQRED